MKTKLKLGFIVTLALVATIAFAAADKYISSSGDIVLKTAASKKINLNDTLYTTQAGYVQVGTTATQSKVNIGAGSLWINSNTTGDGIQFDIPGSGTPGKDYQIANTGVSDTMTFGGTGVSAATKIYHNVSSGNVGIGAVPSEKLEVTRSDAGIVQKWTDSAHDSVVLSISGSDAKLYTLSTTKLQFGTHGNADPVAMTILDGGNVGINVTNPVFKLQVAGGIAAGLTTGAGIFSISPGISGYSCDTHCADNETGAGFTNPSGTCLKAWRTDTMAEIACNVTTYTPRCLCAGAY